MDGLEQYRFLNPILIIGPVSMALGWDEVRHVFKASRILLSGMLISGVLLGLQIDVLTKTFGNFEQLQPRLRFAAMLLVMPFLWFLLIRVIEKVGQDAAKPRVKAVGVFALFALVVPIAALVKKTPGQYDYAHQLIGPSFTNAHQIECLDWVRNATDRTAVVASYMWRFGIDPSTEKWFLVSAVSERRTFVDGPMYVENPQSDALKLRQDITTRFVEIAPNYADRAVMLKAGVEYFIVDTRWTRRQTWEPYASRVFSNQDCIVLRLNKPPS